MTISGSTGPGEPQRREIEYRRSEKRPLSLHISYTEAALRGKAMRSPLCPATARRIIAVRLLRVPGRSFVEVPEATAAIRHDRFSGIADSRSESNGDPLDAVDEFVPVSSATHGVLKISRLRQSDAQRFRWTI